MKVVVFDSDAATREMFGAALPGETVVYIDGPATLDALKANADAEIVSVFVSSAFKREQMDVLPGLKMIAARSTGVDHIDTAYAKESGITVSNVPKYGAHTVAEFTFALMLSLSRRLFDAAYQVREKGNFNTAELEGFDLFGKTLGVLGTGTIGRNVVSIARGFGMRVLMFDKFPDKALESESARYVTLDELLGASDIVTLHVPYVPENQHLIGKENIAKMKKGAFIVNTARGELIDTEALLEALKQGRIAGAGLDVLEEERALKDEMELVRGMESIHSLKAIIRDHILIDMPRVIVTPHIAFFSREAYREIIQTSAQNISAFIKGSPTNRVAV